MRGFEAFIAKLLVLDSDMVERLHAKITRCRAHMRGQAVASFIGFSRGEAEFTPGCEQDECFACKHRFERCVTAGEVKSETLSVVR